MKKHTILTRTGRRVDPFSMSLDDIIIEDIASGLSNESRFAGQGWHHSSVAQHSVIVANNLPPELKLAGLLHDASEAYMKDIPHPWKSRWFMGGYRWQEKRLMAKIYKKFNVHPLNKYETALLKGVDSSAGALEKGRLFGNWAQYWDSPYIIRDKPEGQKDWNPWSPIYANLQFLLKFRELTNGTY